MPAAIYIMLLAAAGAFEHTSQGVHVRVEVYSNRYDWTITNLSAEPIRGFAIDAHHTYNHEGPPDWHFPNPMPANAFIVHAGNAGRVLRPGESAVFSARVNSRGAILGVGDLRLELANGETLVIPGVWQPIPESRGMIVLVAGVLAALAGLHVALGEWRRRRQRSAPA